MMSVMFVLLAKRAFSDAIEGVNSIKFSFAPLVCSKPLPTALILPLTCSL